MDGYLFQLSTYKMAMKVHLFLLFSFLRVSTSTSSFLQQNVRPRVAERVSFVPQNITHQLLNTLLEGSCLKEEEHCVLFQCAPNSTLVLSYSPKSLRHCQ